MSSTLKCRNVSTCGFSVEKAGVLVGSEICRILPAAVPEVQGNYDRPTRSRFCASATCGFVAKNRVVLGGFRFFPALPKYETLQSVF